MDAPARLHVDLHTVALGDGPALVALHGGPGLDHTYLRPWLDPLADGHRLVYVDQRGHGRSPRPADPEELDHEGWADDVEAVRRSLGGEPVVIFGHSWGAFIALEYALRHPGGLSGLVLCSGAPALDYTERSLELARARADEEQFAALLEALSGPAPDDATFQARWNAVLPVYFARPDPEVLRRMDAGAIYSAAAYNRGMFGCIPSYDVREGLSEIRVPALILGGRHDWITPPDPGPGRLADGLPEAELHIFEDSGHFPFIEEPEAFLRITRDWLLRRAAGEGE